MRRYRSMSKEKALAIPDLKKNWQTLLLAALLIAEFIFIININLFHISDTVDEDFAGMIHHAMEIASNKKLLLNNWFYPTTGEFDTTLLFAVPLYWITRNIYLAFGIVNIINAALLGYALYRVLKLAGASYDYILLGMCMALAAYDFGMLDYSNMLFFCGSQYVYKAVLPLLFISVIFSDARRKKAASIAEYCIFYGLFFLTSFSSGIYVFLCGITPILLCSIIIAAHTASIDRKTFALHSAITILAAFTGTFFHNLCRLEVHSFNSDLMKIRHDTTFSEILGNVINSLVDVIDPIAKDIVPATSFEGIAYAFKWFMVFLVFVGLFAVPGCFGIYLIRKEQKSPTVRENIASAMISVFLFNSLIVFLTVHRARYHLIGFFPLIVCSCIVLEDFFPVHKKIPEKVLLTGIAAMYAVLIAANITVFTPRYFAHEGIKTGFIDNEFCQEIKDIADSNGVSVFAFTNMVEQAELMTLYDDSRNYVGFYAKDREVRTYDNYILYADRSRLADRNILAASETGYEQLPDYIKNNYTEISYIGQFKILLSDSCPLDGGTFIVRDEKTIDLPVSPGYTYAGDIGANGYLYTAQTGNVLDSGSITAEIPFNYTINYDLDASIDTSVTLSVYRDDILCDSVDLNSTSHSVSLDLDGRSDYQFVLNKQGDGVLTVREIEFLGR